MRLCELASGTVIAPGQVVPHLGDAEIERIVYAGASPPEAAAPTRTTAASNATPTTSTKATPSPTPDNTNPAALLVSRILVSGAGSTR
jgi:hypothetical protein